MQIINLPLLIIKKNIFILLNNNTWQVLFTYIYALNKKNVIAIIKFNIIDMY